MKPLQIYFIVAVVIIGCNTPQQDIQKSQAKVDSVSAMIEANNKSIDIDSPAVEVVDSPEMIYIKELSELKATRDIVMDKLKRMDDLGLVDKNVRLWLEGEKQKAENSMSLTKYEHLTADRELYFNHYSEKEKRFNKQYPELK